MHFVWLTVLANDSILPESPLCVRKTTEGDRPVDGSLIPEL